jgi:hypothetical protein
MMGALNEGLVNAAYLVAIKLIVMATIGLRIVFERTTLLRWKALINIAQLKLILLPSIQIHNPLLQSCSLNLTPEVLQWR